MFEENQVMEEIDKFFEDDEKYKKKFKLFLMLKLDAEYQGTDIQLNVPIKKEVKRNFIRVHRKIKKGDNLF